MSLVLRKQLAIGQDSASNLPTFKAGKMFRMAARLRVALSYRRTLVDYVIFTMIKGSMIAM